MSKKNITYVFTGNRKSKFETQNIQAKEFYYGITELDKEQYNLEIIEPKKRSNLKNIFLYVFDKLMNKFVSLPFYTLKFVNFKNLKTFINSDHIFVVNESAGCSVLPLIIINNLFKKNKIYLFVMGLYSKNLKYPNLMFLHHFFLRSIYKRFDFLFFLGKGELRKAKQFHDSSEKLVYFPFHLDTQFWSTDNLNLSRNDQIIFVGNDGNRNVSLLIDIAKSLPSYKFLFISQIEELKYLNIPNVRVIFGKWGSDKITDSHIREYYKKSKLCIIPLKETNQPSGQSVTLQSLSIGVPVVISKTEGFWDLKNFVDNKNIIFCENKLDIWVDKIKNLYNDNKSLNELSTNGKSVVLENYNLELLKSRISQYIN